MASSHDQGSFSETFSFLTRGKHLSQHEREVFNSIVDRLPDAELFSLLQERRRWNPRNSTSTNSVSTSRSSALSMQSAPSLRGSSVSSKRESMMSLDDFKLDDSFSTLENTPDYPSTLSIPQAPMDNTPTVFQEASSTHTDSVPQPGVKRLRTSSKQAAKSSKRYFCTSCPANARPGFVRRSDWKKHETSEHEPGKLYVCAHSKDTNEPCRKWFYSSKPLHDHHIAVHDHRGCRRNCPAVRESKKVVFGCGFRGCEAVFVEDKHGGRDAWYDRCKHVADHFEDGAVVEDWDYSQMIQNLLRQPILSSLWRSTFKERDLERGILPTRAYRWDPTLTEHLLTSLETTAYKHAHTQLDLHQNAIKFLEELHNHAKLPFREVDQDFADLPLYPECTPLDLANMLDQDFSYANPDWDHLSLPDEEVLYPSSLKPVFDPVLSEGKAKHARVSSADRSSPAEINSSVQRLTAELLRDPTAWYDEEF